MQDKWKISKGWATQHKEHNPSHISCSKHVFKTFCFFLVKMHTDFSQESPQPSQDSVTEGHIMQQAQGQTLGGPEFLLSIVRALPKPYKPLSCKDSLTAVKTGVLVLQK